MTTAPVQHSVSLSWEGSTNPKIIGYRMDRSTIHGNFYGLLASAVGMTIFRDQGGQTREPCGAGRRLSNAGSSQASSVATRLQ
jgi:hypothetical protein